MEKSLKLLLDSATESGSRNVLTSSEIREFLATYLAEYNEDLRQFPEIAADPHFDIAMDDQDSARLALFVAIVFHGNDVSFAAGRGPTQEIRTFAESESEDVLDVIPQVTKRFQVFGQRLQVPRSELDAWLATSDGIR